MRNISDSFAENIKTHFSCSVTSFESHAVYEIKWKNVAEPDTAQMKIWRMRITCCISKAAKRTQNM